jgi:hypothetical protein
VLYYEKKWKRGKEEYIDCSASIGINGIAWLKAGIWVSEEQVRKKDVRYV